MSSERLEGGCLCGAVRYTIEGPLGPIGFCHCRTCQKAEGGAFATTARLPRDAVRWQRGEASLRAWESSPGKKRHFCGHCGAKLFAAWDDQDELILRVGSLDGDPGARPLVHIWTEESAPWYALVTRLPTFPRGVPRRSEDGSSPTGRGERR
ncbi:MAG: GFA family protein [bacterium]|nr:GFA family protein [bacterium]